MTRSDTINLQQVFAARFGITTPSKAALGAIAAWCAVILYAASNSIITLLVDIGQMNPLADGSNAITYTNLYLLGSLLSIVPMALIYRRDLTRENLQRMEARHWRLLAVSAVLSSVITPALFFYALEHTTVTNVVLVGRIEPPLFLLATWFLLRERLNPWALLAGLTALAGAVVVLGAGSTAGMFSLGKGEIATVAATLTFIASTIVTRAGLRDVPIGIFAVFRTVIGVSLYFALVGALFGADQFRGILEPIVWKWVWIYAGIVIVLGQIAWNFGLKHAGAGDVSLATSFSPLAAIIIAMVLLGEDPGPGLIPGGTLIILAIAIGHLGRARRSEEETPAEAPRAVIRPQWETPGWMPNHVAVAPNTGVLAIGAPARRLTWQQRGKTGPLFHLSLQKAQHGPPILWPLRRRVPKRPPRWLMPPSVRPFSDQR